MESHCYTYYGYTGVETCNEKEQGRIGRLIHCSTNLLYVHASWIMPFIIWKGCQSSYDTFSVWILITKPQKWSPTCSIRASIRWLSWTQLYQLFAIIISVPSHSNHYSVYWSSTRLIRRCNWNWSNFAHPSFHVHIKIVIGSSTGVFACRYSMGSVQPRVLSSPRKPLDGIPSPLPFTIALISRPRACVCWNYKRKKQKWVWLGLQGSVQGFNQELIFGWVIMRRKKEFDKYLCS